MKIISGGQVGADIAALQFAKSRGLETGGWMPKGFKTRNGECPDYAEIYGMVETNDGGYPERTRMNVFSSDVTLRFGHNFRTYGEMCTARFIREYKKPHLDIWLNPVSKETMPTPWYVAEWIIMYRPQVINIAGNSYPTIEVEVRIFLHKVFNILEAYNE